MKKETRTSTIEGSTTKTQTQLRGNPSDLESKDHDMEDEGKLVKDALSIAENEIESAENYDVGDTISGVLKSAYGIVEDSIKFSIGKIFGSNEDVTEEQMEEVAVEISKKLELKAEEDLRSQADAIVARKKEELENIVVSEHADISAVKLKEDIIIADLSSEIKEAAEEVVKRLKKDSLKIEQEVIEEKLNKLTEIVDDQIELVVDLVKSKRKKTIAEDSEQDTSEEVGSEEEGSEEEGSEEEGSEEEDTEEEQDTSDKDTEEEQDTKEE